MRQTSVITDRGVVARYIHLPAEETEAQLFAEAVKKMKHQCELENYWELEFVECLAEEEAARIVAASASPKTFARVARVLLRHFLGLPA